MTTQAFHVTGMTCDHCVHAVTDELQALSGVRAVDVGPAPGPLPVDANPTPTQAEGELARAQGRANALA